MEIQKKNTNLIKFCQNLQFLTNVFFVTEISNRHFCKLDKFLRNFLNWQFFVFLIVFEIDWFETCIFAQLSCDMLEGYCRTFLVTCTLITKACSITLRLFSVRRSMNSSLPAMQQASCRWWMMNAIFMLNHIAFLYQFNSHHNELNYVSWNVIIIITLILLPFFFLQWFCCLYSKKYGKQWHLG